LPEVFGRITRQFRHCHELDEVFFRTEDFFFEEALFLVDAFFLEEAFFLGTFAPARRASESPMAIACFRLVTFFPDFPLFKVPLFRSCMTFLTFACAFFPYLAIVFSWEAYTGPPICKHYPTMRLERLRLRMFPVRAISAARPARP
jgi:hypothetical protein